MHYNDGMDEKKIIGLILTGALYLGFAIFIIYASSTLALKAFEFLQNRPVVQYGCSDNYDEQLIDRACINSDDCVMTRDEMAAHNKRVSEWNEHCANTKSRN